MCYGLVGTACAAIMAIFCNLITAAPAAPKALFLAIMFHSNLNSVICQSAYVPPELSGQRLDAVCAQLFAEFSRSRLSAWIKDGQLRLNGEQARPRDVVKAGALLQLNAQMQAQGAWQGQAIALNICFEDAHILVLDKPAGLVVHPAAGHADGTLLNALLHHLPQLAQLPRAGIVHRLDKDTSGLMVVAKTLPAQTALVAQLQARSLSRVYEAVISGTPLSGGTVDAPIGRHPVQRQKMAVTSGPPLATGVSCSAFVATRISASS